LNIQPIEKRLNHRTGMLEVHSVFYTIQGEGPFSGHPAVFVRLAGCNLQCPGCDTEYTGERVLIGPAGLVEVVNETNKAATLVVITGGEPFRQTLGPAVEALLSAGYRVQLETNGTLFEPDFPYDRVTVVCSPKAMLAPGFVQYLQNGGANVAFKYVAQAAHIAGDGLPTQVLGHPVMTQVARPPEAFNGAVYLQPAEESTMFDLDEEANAENLAAVVESCLQHGYTLCLQVHKIIGKD